MSKNNLDFNQVKEFLDSLTEHLKFANEMIDDSITIQNNLDIKMKDVIRNTSKEELENLDEDKLMDLLTMGFSGEGDNTNILNLKENQTFDEEYKDKSFLDYAKHILISIKESMNELESIEKEKNEVLNQVKSAHDEWSKYFNSEEYRNYRLKQIEHLKEKAERESNTIEKNKIKKMIETLESAESLDFLFRRLRTNPRDALNIKETYFDKRRSSLVMKKFNSRAERLGFNKNIYKTFFNIEENFLPEQYHVFNNLFLFHVMRFISYTDVYNKADKLFSSTIIVKLYNLIYHKFPSQSLEDEFIEKIIEFEEYFLPYKDYFRIHNITSPTHPERIQADIDYERAKRNLALNKIKERDIPYEEVEAMSTEDMIKLLNTNNEEEKGDNDNETKNDENVKDHEEENEKSIQEEDVMVVGRKLPTNQNDNKEEDFVVPINAGSINEIEVLMEESGNYYVEDGDTYAYCDNNGEILKEDIPENEVLTLLNENRLVKKLIRL